MHKLIPPLLLTEIRLKWLCSVLYPFFLIKEKYEYYILEKKYEARVTGQLMILESYLNRQYDAEQRRIRIITREQYDYALPLRQERVVLEEKYLSLSHENNNNNHIQLSGESNIGEGKDFVVITPVTMSEETKRNIFGFTKKYTPLGIILQVK